MMPHGVKITDGTGPGGSGGLAFDLPEIIKALGSRALISNWRCTGLNYVSTDDRDVSVLERTVQPEGHVSGAELSEGVDGLVQVIDGEFSVLSSNGESWVIVRAVDSSWWEVWSGDESVLAGIEAHFRATERIANHAG